MFDMSRGRQIEDRAKEGRIEYRDKGPRIVKFLMEG